MACICKKWLMRFESEAAQRHVDPGSLRCGNQEIHSVNGVLIRDWDTCRHGLERLHIDQRRATLGIEIFLLSPARITMRLIEANGRRIFGIDMQPHKDCAGCLCRALDTVQQLTSYTAAALAVHLNGYNVGDLLLPIVLKLDNRETSYAVLILSDPRRCLCAHNQLSQIPAAKAKRQFETRLFKRIERSEIPLPE
jgi:hypothetical protein